MKLISGLDRFHVGVFHRQSIQKQDRDSVIYLDGSFDDINNFVSIECAGIIIDLENIFSHVISLFLTKDVFIIALNKDEISNLKEDHKYFFDLKNLQISERIVSYVQEPLFDTKIVSELITTDKKKINIFSTIKSIKNAEDSKKMGICRAGLVSVEFLMSESQKYSKSELEAELFRICATMGGEVTIRLYDFAIDKLPPWFEFFEESKNLRGIRLANNTDYEIFVVELLEIILKIKKFYNISVLVPFVTNSREIQYVRDILSERDAEIADTIKVGAMIETPYAVFAAADQNLDADFFSVGTNDLLQYFYGCGRDDTSSSYIDPYSCEFIKLLKTMNDETKRKTKICGQLPLFPYMLELLMVLGYHSFSITPNCIPMVCSKITQFNVSKHEKKIKEIISAQDNQRLKEYLSDHF